MKTVHGEFTVPSWRMAIHTVLDYTQSDTGAEFHVVKDGIDDVDRQLWRVDIDDGKVWHAMITHVTFTEFHVEVWFDEDAYLDGECTHS